MRSQIYMDPTILITQWLPVLNICEMFLNKAWDESVLLHIAVHMWAFSLPLLWVSVLYKHADIPTACQEDNENMSLWSFGSVSDEKEGKVCACTGSQMPAREIRPQHGIKKSERKKQER